MPSYKRSFAVCVLAQISASIAAFNDGSPRSTLTAVVYDHHIPTSMMEKKYERIISRTPTYSPTIKSSSSKADENILVEYDMYDYVDMAQKRRRRVALIERRLNAPARIQNESKRNEANVVATVAAAASRSNGRTIQSSQTIRDNSKSLESENEKVRQQIYTRGLRGCISRSPTYTPHDDIMDQYQEDIESYIYKWPTPSPRTSRIPSASKSPTFYGTTNELDNYNDSKWDALTEITNEKTTQHNTSQTISISKENDDLVKINNTKLNYNPVISHTENTVVHFGEDESSLETLEDPSDYPSTISEIRKDYSRSSLFSSLLQHDVTTRSDI